MHHMYVHIYYLDTPWCTWISDLSLLMSISSDAPFFKISISIQCPCLPQDTTRIDAVLRCSWKSTKTTYMWHICDIYVTYMCLNMCEQFDIRVLSVSLCIFLYSAFFGYSKKAHFPRCAKAWNHGLETKSETRRACVLFLIW